MFFFSACVLTLISTTAASCLGQTKSPFDEKLDDAIERFNKKKRGAQNFVQVSFDKELKRVRRSSSISEATRAELSKRIKSYKRDFERSGKFPNIATTIELEIKYQDKLNRGFLPIAKLIEDRLRQANRENDKRLVQDLLEKKRYLEINLLGSTKIAGGSKLKGRRVAQNGNTIPYVLRIDAISDAGYFEGTVEDNPGIAGHWRYRVTGSLDGNKVQFQMSENLRGSLIYLKGQGVFTGNRLLAQLSQKTSKGKASQHWLTLNN